MNKAKELCICGIGPGHPDYILPVVHREVQQAELLVGARRHLDIFGTYHKPELLFNGNLSQLKLAIENRKENKIVVLVSGDTGFHSLRRFLQSAFSSIPVRCLPGISSFQYLYAKLGLGYEQALKASLHGTNFNFIDQLTNYESVFLLTDQQNNWKAIARLLTEAGLGNTMMHIGNRLSYPDETILSAPARQLLDKEYAFSLCAVIVEGIKNINPDHQL